MNKNEPQFGQGIPQPVQYQNVVVRVGSVEAVPSHVPPAVTNTGPVHAPILNFKIPQGKQGDPGTNASLNIGTVEHSLPGSSLKITNSGDATNAILNFSIPQGNKGDKGDQGQTGPRGIGGQPGTITVGQVTPLPPGSTPTVTNSGTMVNAILNFGFPACNCQCK